MPPRSFWYWPLGVVAVVFGGPACTPDIGDECVVHSDCSQTGDRICEPNFPGGYCTMFNCDPGKCPDESVCIGFYTAPSTKKGCWDPSESRFERSFCMKTCNNDRECRSGYVCVDYRTPESSRTPPGNALVAVVVERGSYKSKVCTLKQPPPPPPEPNQSVEPTVCSPDPNAVFPQPPGAGDAGLPGDGGSGAPNIDGSVRDAAGSRSADGSADAANRGSP